MRTLHHREQALLQLLGAIAPETSLADRAQPLFDQGFDLFDKVEDDLTMHGLRLINDYNKELSA